MNDDNSYTTCTAMPSSVAARITPPMHTQKKISEFFNNGIFSPLPKRWKIQQEPSLRCTHQFTQAFVPIIRPIIPPRIFENKAKLTKF